MAKKYDSPLIYDPLELDIENHEDEGSGDENLKNRSIIKEVETSKTR